MLRMLENCDKPGACCSMHLGYTWNARQPEVRERLAHGKGIYFAEEISWSLKRHEFDVYI